MFDWSIANHLALISASKHLELIHSEAEPDQQDEQQQDNFEEEDEVIVTVKTN